MILLIRKRAIQAAALFLVFLCGMSAVLWKGRQVTLSAAGTAIMPEDIIYVVDPGHGGEDGGAVAGNGTVESMLNLEIALRLNDLLRFCGRETAMTRREDVSIYSDGASTLHEKKVSDLKNRAALVNGLGNAVLVSIHQNTLPSSPSVQGAQAFYNAVPGADLLARQIQASLNIAVNGQREKTCRKIDESIYLMKNVTAPAVLVECGFLSNAEETARLCQPAYQTRLALSIAAGLFEERQEETA